MTQIKAISSDDLFDRWLKQADAKLLEKHFKKKKVDFKRDNVSAVETVKNVSKFLVIYFEKNMKEALASTQVTSTEQIYAKDLTKTKFFDFEGKKVEPSTWKGDKTVPSYPSVKQITCTTCAGAGGKKCKSCGGTGSIKCSSCDGKGKLACKTCKGIKTVDYELDITNGLGKKFKATKKVPCPDCHGTGTVVCPDCAGILKVRCKTCDGSGLDTCNDCHGHGVYYEYQVVPVPFNVAKKDSAVYYSKAVEKFIDKQTVEKMVSSKDIQGITITNPDDLKEDKLKPQLNYWTNDASKTCDEAKKDYKDFVKKNMVKKDAKIMVFPALQLDCKAVDGTEFEIFGIGVSGGFAVDDSKFI
jgi:hypothetical protein